MSKYTIEPHPPEPSGGMTTGKIPSGVKVTHVDTGISATCDVHRLQYKNKHAATKAIKAALDYLEIGEDETKI